MNIYDYLKHDHELMYSLFSQMQNATLVEEKKALIQNLKSLLEKHSKLENVTIYNVLHENHELDIEADALNAHDDILMIANELDNIQLDGMKWNKYINVLQEKVYHHNKQEEDIIFPLIKKVATPHLNNELTKQIKLVDRTISL